jgi:DNA-binding transcriptional ArsR family regulator
MNTPSDAPKTVAVTPLPDLDLLAAALGHPARWKILKELSAGEPRMVRELAQVAGCSPDMASKHLAKLRKAGAVVQGRGRLYQIQPHHLPAPGERVVDFGHCLLRLDAAGA